jgi:hypothetical protein
MFFEISRLTYYTAFVNTIRSKRISKPIKMLPAARANDEWQAILDLLRRRFDFREQSDS